MDKRCDQTAVYLADILLDLRKYFCLHQELLSHVVVRLYTCAFAAPRNTISTHEPSLIPDFLAASLLNSRTLESIPLTVHCGLRPS